MNFRLPEKLPEDKSKPIKLIKYPSKEFPHGLGWVRGPPQPDAPRLLTDEEHAKLAPSIILEDQTPVGDQESYGSCTANCAENALKISSALKTGNYVNGSRMQLYRDERALGTGAVLNTDNSIAGVTVNSWGVYSSPLITNGWVCYGGMDGYLYFVATDGTAAWALPVGIPLVTTPATDNSKLFMCVASGLGTYELRMYSFPVDNTTPPTAIPGTMLDTSNGYFSSPAVDANGVAYVTDMGTFEVVEYLQVMHEYLINGACATDSTWLSTPAVANGLGYVAGNTGKIYAIHNLNNSPGPTLLWTYATGAAPGGAVVMPTPTVVNGIVYVGSFDNKVYAINATTGALLWSFTTGGDVLSCPAISNGVLYVGSYDNKLYALNATTGAEVWSFTTGGAVFSSPCVYNDVVYVGSNDGKVYAINASTGVEVWNYATGGAVHSSPAVSDEPLNGVTTTLVYVGSDDGCFYVLDAATGYNVWGVTTCDTGCSIQYTALCLGNTGIIPETQRPYIPQNLDQPVASRAGAITASPGNVYASAPATTIANIQASIAASNPVVIGFDVYYGIYGVGSDGQLPTPMPIAVLTDLPVGATSATVASTADLVVPDYVTINGNNGVMEGWGQTIEITTINGNTITFINPLLSPYYSGFTTTDASGNYQFTVFGVGAGDTYWYRTQYAGSGTYASATSNAVEMNSLSSSADMPALLTTSTLTLAASTTTPSQGQAVTLSGTLKAGGTPIVGATVTLQFGGIPSLDPVGTPIQWGDMTTTVSEFIIGGHGVCILGYDNTHPCLDGTTGAFWVKNSWGTGWGAPGGISPAGGYFWLPYSYFSVVTRADPLTYAVDEAMSVNANAPTVPTPPPTHLALTTSASDPDTSGANQTFTLSGTLLADNVTPISGMTVTLQSSTNPADNTLWTTITPSTTSDANGKYTFSHSESVIGAYYYQTTYAGTTNYASSISNMIYVGIVSSSTPPPPPPVSQLATTLTISAPSTTMNSEDFTISGTLTDPNSAGIAAMTIQLQSSIDDASWNDVTTAVTDVNGAYLFTESEAATGTYYFQTTFDGTDTYTTSTSASATITVTPAPPSLSITMPTLAQVNQYFTLSGTLSSGTAGIANETITLQTSTDNATWNNVTTTTTDANGNYTFTDEEASTGTFYFRTVFAGGA